MKMRMTLVLDREITDEQALEHYGVTDPYAVAQSMNTEAQAKLVNEYQNEAVEMVGVSVVPLP